MSYILNKLVTRHSNNEWLLFYGWLVIQIPLIIWHILCPQEVRWYVAFVPLLVVVLRFIYVIFRIWLTSNIRIDKLDSDN